MATFNAIKLKEFKQQYTRNDKTPVRLILGVVDGYIKKKYVFDKALSIAERHILSWKTTTVEVKKVDGDWIYYLKEGGDPSTSNFDDILSNIQYGALVPLDQGFAAIRLLDGEYSTTLVGDDDIPSEFESYIICDHYKSKPAIKRLQKANYKWLALATFLFGACATFLGYTGFLAHPDIDTQSGQVNALPMLQKIKYIPEGQVLKQIRYRNEVWSVDTKEIKNGAEKR